MKKEIILVILLIFSISFVSAQVLINEFESKPGVENEWIELYNNDAAEINLTGWTIEDNTGSTYGSGSGNTSLDGLIIPPQRFLVLEKGTDFSFALNDHGDIIILKQGLTEIDKVSFGNFNDSNTTNNAIAPDTNESSGRIIDGRDTNVDNVDFKIFANTTKGLPNQLTIISNKSIVKTCILSSDNVTLKAQATGFCIEQVIFSTIINNSQQNFTGIQIPNTDFYTATLLPSLFQGNETILWTVYTHDCLDRTEKDGEESFKVNARTKLTISPPSPNGQNNWYISEPTFTLTNLDANNIMYRWNGNLFNYNNTGPFGLEGAPNGNSTAGILVLKYWSDVCAGESEQNRTFYFDFTNPIIKDISPTGQITDATPEIYAYLDEVYGTSSGINKTKVKIFVDNADVTSIAAIEPADTIDYTVSYTPALDLSIGIHNVIINATDNAGRNSQLNWTFEILGSAPPITLNLTVYSPKNGSYSEKRNSFNVTTSQIVDAIEYINDAENNPKWKTLCKNCNEYGFSKKKTISLQDGENNIIIRAVQGAADVQENINLFIDSQPPKISKVEPRNNLVVNGSFFQVKYTEDNVQSIKLFWNPSVTLQNCPSGRNQVCSTSVNLTDFNNQQITYHFEISDGINNATSSKNTTVLVDTISPKVTINLPQNGTLYRSKVPFNITISEKSNIEYFDLSSGTRWTKLCSNCNEYGSEKLKTKRFAAGNHDILIRAVDKAGNSDVKQVSFTA